MSRVLTLRDLNRATLARQLLLERRRLSPLEVIERLAGMQAQWAPAPYVGIWTRVSQFRRETLERAVLRGDVLKPTVMRGTLHLVTARDYPIFFAALRDYLWWSDPESAVAGERAAAPLRRLYGDGAKAWGVARAHLEREHGLAEELTRRRAWYVARIRGHVLHAPETALWRLRKQTLYAAVPEPEEIDVQAARRELVRRYLAAFGPASRADVAAWSGMRIRDFAPALEALEPLRRFQDETGRELLDLPRAPLPPPDTPAPVRFLPKWDNVLLGFADRRRVLPEEYRKVVIGKNGDVAQTFLADGFVAGTWRVVRGRVLVEPFEPLPRSVQRDVDEESARLEAWLR
ncbi:MAG: winged helix DNA-binding domain-containing protein [Actinomycetota bacterium]|nr:winged helix DNA-binding domain-containing protein [Actinomycetota bacterium]